VELSPLAREKLAHIGELTAEEKARLKYAEQLRSLLADYFTHELSPDELWRELRRHKDEGRGFMVKEAQLRMLDAMRLQSSDADIDRLRRGLLAAETVNDNGNSAQLEQDLDAIEGIRRQYHQERARAYDKIRAEVEKQVSLAARQLAGRAAASGAVIDVQSSVEATVKASPQWQTFATRHDATYHQKFKEHIARLKEKLGA